MHAKIRWPKRERERGEDEEEEDAFVRFVLSKRASLSVPLAKDGRADRSVSLVVAVLT